MIENEKIYRSVCSSLKQDCHKGGYSVLADFFAVYDTHNLQDFDMMFAVTKNLADKGYLNFVDGSSFKLTIEGYKFFLKYDENL